MSIKQKQLVSLGLGRNPGHAYLGVSPVGMNETYFRVNMHRIGLFKEESFPGNGEMIEILQTRRAFRFQMGSNWVL